MQKIHYEEIVHNLGDWVWAVDHKGEYVYCSEQVYKFLGYRPEEIIGKKPFDFMESTEAQRVASAFIEHSSKKEKIINFKNTHISKSGSAVVLETNAIPILDKDGELIGYQGIDRDITQVQKISQEFDKQKELDELVFKKTHSGILVLDLQENKFIDVNEIAVKMLKYDSRESLLSKHPAELSPKYQPDGTLSSEKSEQMIQRAISNGAHSFEWLHLTNNGENIWIEVNLTAVEIDGKNVLHTLWKDISKRKSAQKDLQNQLTLMHNIIDTVPVRIFWKDREGIYLGANELFLKDAQLQSRDEIIGKNDFEMPWGATEAKNYRADDIDVMQNANAKLNIEETQTDQNAQTITLLTSKVPLKDSEGEIIGVLGTYTDITTLKNTQNELLKQKNIVHHQAHYDELTGLPNRALFQNKLKERISKIQNTKNKIALLFMDLDNFKAINDSFGHHIGDEVLKIVTQRLTNAIKTQGSISRLGGDEFAIILDTLEEEQNISLISNTLLKSLAEPIHLHGNTLYASSSIGISVYPEDTLSMQDLIKFADSAMYKAKDEGKNNFQYYNPKLTELAFERVMMESSLKSALQNSEFVVYYQPQINALSREIIGMEALVRWNHPAMGIVPPSKFIPLAQTTGLIVELDRYVMKTAMTQLSQWYKKGLSPGMLAMNLSVKQLQQEDFLEFLQELIVSTQCDPHWLELEVTEDQIMQHPERAISLLQAISDIGLELAVDDFGTGYSSLAYLKRLPIDKLKIDQMFIRELPYNEEDASITQAVIALAKSLKLKVIAEGVETQEQCNFVIENGCQNIQGYFFSRPLPALEFEKLLK